MDKIQLYVTGGSGAGASTIGQILAEKLTIPFIDSDSFFHKPTDPPFQEQFSKPERNRLIQEELERSESWVLGGSISTWGISDITFSHAVLLNVGRNVRLERLKQREAERFGTRIKENGDMYDDHKEFIRWASYYETGEREGRSLPIERQFISQVSQNLLEIETELPLETLEKVITAYLSETQT